MIDLHKFASKKSVVAPVYKGQLQFNRKQYTIEDNTFSGWARIELLGNSSKLVAPVFIETEEITAKTILGYTYNDKIIFQNFDVAKRKYNFEVMKTLYFNNMPAFSAVEAIVWEDNNIYYYRPNYKDVLAGLLHSFFSEDTKNISTIKYITPELKTLYLFHEIEHQQFIADIEQARKQQELKDFQKTIQGRLMIAFARVGAKLLNYSVEGQRVVVDWQLEKTGRSFNSVLDSQTGRVIEAGYCMSNADKDHSVSSLVLTAQDYDEEGLIYVTRYI